MAKEIEEIFAVSEAQEAAYNERVRKREEEAETQREERAKIRKIKREEAWEQLKKDGVISGGAAKEDEATAAKKEVPEATSMEVGEEESQEVVKRELCDMIQEVNTMCERFDGSSSSSSSGVRISYTIHVCYLEI